ncbi:MAG: hypothetical protein U5L72_12915 [Bacteroidales bacterium]|nr:hypothetical protein [Bacteroidales bacterium]
MSFWGEDSVSTDLKRLNLPLSRPIGIGGGYHTTALCNLISVAAGDVSWEWLIPKAELDANDSMVQNPL